MCLGVLTLKSACNQGANDRDKKNQKNGQNIPRNTNREADLKTWQKFFGTENVHLTKHGQYRSRSMTFWSTWGSQ